MKTQLTALVVLAALASVRAETIPVETLVAQAERSIETAYLRASETGLAEAVKPLDAALASDPKNPALLYERAFAQYAGVTALRMKNNRAATVAALEKTILLLEHLKGQPWEAEAAALHSSVLGELIGQDADVWLLQTCRLEDVDDLAFGRDRLRN